MKYDFYQDITNILKENSTNDRISLNLINNLLARKYRINKKKTRCILEELQDRELIELDKRIITIR